MNAFISSLIIGFIQGVTEFFPISSSGHTLLIYSLLGVTEFDIVRMQIFVHFGSFCALVVYFRKVLIRYTASVFRCLFRFSRSAVDYENVRLVILLLISVIPIGIFGFLFQPYIENTLHEATVVPISLIIVAFLFILVEWRGRQNRLSLSNIKLIDALIIGFSQIFSLIPGVSRSGITIVTGMSRDLKRSVAAEFTFMLAIPTLLGITLKKFLDISTETITSVEIFYYGTGFLVSFVIGFLSIKFLLVLLKKYPLTYFAYYRILLAIIVIIYYGLF